MSSVYNPKPVDGSFGTGRFNDLIISGKLQISGGQQGQILQAANNISDMVFKAKHSDRTIDCQPGTNTFSAAIFQALNLSPTAISPVGIVLYPGLYSETGSTTITIPSFVSVYPLSNQLYYTVIRLENGSFPAGTPFITMNAVSGIENVSLIGNNNCDEVLRVSGNPFQGISFNGLLISGGTTALKIDTNTLCFCTNNLIETAPFDGINQNSSVMIDVLTGAQFFYVSSNVSNFLLTPGVIGYRLNGTAIVTLSTGDSNFMETSIQLNDTSSLRALTSEMVALTSGTSTGVQVNNSASFQAIGCQWRGGWNTHVDSTASTTTVNVQSSEVDTDKLSLAPGSKVNLNYYDSGLNNLGNHIIGNQLTGQKGGITSSLFGEGSISLQALSAQKFQVGVGFTDVSNTIKPSQNTPVILFNALATDNAFYLGDDSTFSGFSYEVTTTGVYNTSDIVYEYWDGLTWVSFVTMVNNLNPPYESYSINIATVIQSQNIRFENDILLNNWTQTIVNGVTKFWIRARIVNPITASPAIKNVKFLGNQSKLNPDGTLEYYGLARPRVILPFDLNTLSTLPGGNIQNQDVFLAPTIGIARQNNSFTNGDAISSVFYLQAQQDTSSPVEFLITYFTNGTSTNVFECQIDYACTSTGEQLYSTSGAAVNPPRFKSVTFQLAPNINVTSRQQSSQIKLDSGACTPRTTTGEVSDIIGLTFQRNSDLNPDRLIIVNISLTYLAAYQGFTEF